MKSDEVRFAILKRLKMMPSYGYELFTTFKDMYEITDSSKLYKILRSMKSEGLIEAIGTQKENGRDREILNITTEGKQAYFNHIYESATFFIQLILESMIERMGEEVVTRFKEWGLGHMFDSCMEILLDLSYSLESQLMLLNNIISYFEEMPNFYLLTTNEEIGKLGRFSTINPRIHLFNENMINKPGSIDFIIVMSPLSREKLIGPSGLVNLLKKDGSIVIVTLKDRVRIMSPDLTNGIRNFLGNLFDEKLAEKLSQSFTTMLLPTIVSEKSITSLEIKDILGESFSTTRILPYKKTKQPSFIEIHYARKKKQS
ncbi:MAG: PadR family transcriptional regulator [Promethearchaeota archaeon]